MTSAVLPLPMKKELATVTPLKPLKPAKPTKLHKALQERLRMLVDQPVTAASLFDIAEFARIAQHLLLKLNVQTFPIYEPCAGSMSVSSIPTIYPNPSMAGYIGNPTALATSAPSETYGATLVKELMAVMPGFKKSEPSIDQILRDIESLKKAKKHKLAKRLEKTLDDAVSNLPKVI